jgi:hypothetical protein
VPSRSCTRWARADRSAISAIDPSISAIGQRISAIDRQISAIDRRSQSRDESNAAIGGRTPVFDDFHSPIDQATAFLALPTSAIDP